jgi:hypothetical protein
MSEAIPPAMCQRFSFLSTSPTAITMVKMTTLIAVSTLIAVTTLISVTTLIPVTNFYNFYFPLFFANFHVLELFMPQKPDKSEKQIYFCLLSRGVAGRALVEICIEDISAAFRATDLRFRLFFVIWAGLMHLILRILKY